MFMYSNLEFAEVAMRICEVDLWQVMKYDLLEVPNSQRPLMKNPQ